MMAPHADMAKVAPRLGQLIRMLSSSNDGETLNAARAMGRTLAGVRLDFNDLAAVVEDKVIPFGYTPPSRPTYRADARPADPPPAAKPSKPEPEPKPWPTWGVLSRFQRVAWLHAIDDSCHSFEKNTRPEFDALMLQVIVRPHELLSRKQINLFNRLVRSAWEKGSRA